MDTAQKVSATVRRRDMGPCSWLTSSLRVSSPESPIPVNNTLNNKGIHTMIPESRGIGFLWE